MANVLNHRFVSGVADSTDPTLIQPSNWNDGHVFTGGAQGMLLGRHLTDATYGATWFPSELAIQTITATGVVNDLALGAVGTLRCNNASLLSLTGMTPFADGQVVRIVATNAQVDLYHVDGRSAAANKFTNYFFSGPMSLVAGGSALYQYDGALGRWRILAHDQGGWIAVPYAGTNFTSDAGSWTVDAGDVSNYRYVTRNRTLTLNYYLQATTIAGAPNALSVHLPSTFTSAMDIRAPGVMYDGAFRSTFLTVPLNANTITHNRQDGATWTPNTNATFVYGNLTFEMN